MKFKEHLERIFSFLRKPTYIRYMTTYHQIIQWEGKLTGKPYHFKNDCLVQGESPQVSVRST